MKILILALSTLLLSSNAPKEHVTKGCRCLECPYFQKDENPGTWKAKRSTKLYKQSGNKTAPIVEIPPGEVTTALSGELRNKPGQLQVIFPTKNYKVGDTVYVLQGDAESNMWRVWHNGVEDFENLSAFVSQKQPCRTPSPVCWAKVKAPISSEWWVEIQTKNKMTGWTDAVENFDFDRSSCM